MALVEVDFSYKIKEWGTTTFNVDDPSDLHHIEWLTANYIKSSFDLEDEITNVEVENTKELIS